MERDNLHFSCLARCIRAVHTMECFFLKHQGLDEIDYELRGIDLAFY
jgi:hypothetical protein